MLQSSRKAGFAKLAESGLCQARGLCKVRGHCKARNARSPLCGAADPPRAEERPVERVSRHVGRLLHVIVARAQEAVAVAVAHRCQRIGAGAHSSRVLARNPTAVRTCMHRCSKQLSLPPYHTHPHLSLCQHLNRSVPPFVRGSFARLSLNLSTSALFSSISCP